MCKRAQMKYLPLIFLFFACNHATLNTVDNIEQNQDTLIQQSKDTLVETTANSGTYTWFPEKMTLQERFPPPKGYEREPVADGSFIHYLRNISLLPSDAEVLLFDGSTLFNQSNHAAIIDLDVGSADLQQCADAVIRLRAEYLYSQKRYQDICFNLTNGFKMEYFKWRQGYRLKVKGNKTSWYKTDNPSTDYKSFRKYLDRVYMFAGSYSLSKELISQNVNDIEAGDVFIQGGFPGHAIIVMDVVHHKENNSKMFMIAQSFMPAQSIHILLNNANSKNYCWYELKESEMLESPSWNFYSDELKTWKSTEN
jgi:hypothetical protein